MRTKEAIEADLIPAQAELESVLSDPQRAECFERRRALAKAQDIQPSDAVAVELAHLDQKIAGFTEAERVAQTPVSLLTSELYALAPRGHHAIRAEIMTAQGAYEKAVLEMPAAKVVPFRDALVALKEELHLSMSQGAEPCEHCGRLPTALRHVRGQHRRVKQPDGTLKTVTFWRHAFEVGCANCGDKRALEETPEEQNGADLAQYDDLVIAAAVAKWNGENYLAPKA